MLFKVNPNALFRKKKKPKKSKKKEVEINVWGQPKPSSKKKKRKSSTKKASTTPKTTFKVKPKRVKRILDLVQDEVQVFNIDRFKDVGVDVVFETSGQGRLRISFSQKGTPHQAHEYLEHQRDVDRFEFVEEERKELYLKLTSDLDKKNKGLR